MADRSSSPLSSSSSNDSGEEIFIPYNEREEWKDMDPLPQDDGPNPVVQIAYSEQFRNVYNYFRAVIAKDERSERALALTTECVKLNPSNYTVWYYRRVLLKDLNKDIHQELAYLEQVINENPKNYQVWHHRRVMVEMIRDPSVEKNFTEKMLALDAKNYHAWQHRQWIVSEFGLWDGELEFVETLIDSDIRNNSAWNHRYYIVTRTNTFKSESIVERELNYVLDRIKLAPHNESPWNYLRGVIQDYGLNKFPLVGQTVHKLYSEPLKCRSPHLLSFMIDSIEETLSGQQTPDSKLLETALSLTDMLANQFDKIRKEYWKFIASSLKSNFRVK